MIDLHFHLIPGIDDGPPTLADAIALARAAAAAGVETIVATPHVDDTWGVQPRGIAAAADELQYALADAGVAVTVRHGAEVSLPRLLALEPEEVDAIRLGGGPYLMVESPHSSVAGAFDSVLLDLIAHGERIVIAHPERCPLFQRRPEILTTLVAAGALCSITAGSMYGHFGTTVRDFTLELLRQGLVHNVASDAHDLRRRRPGLREAFHALEPKLPGIARQAELMTVSVPAAILAGTPIPEPRVLARRRPGKRRRRFG